MIGKAIWQLCSVFGVRKKLRLTNINNNNNNYQQSQDFFRNSRESLISAITLCYCGTGKWPQRVKNIHFKICWRVAPVRLIGFIFDVSDVFFLLEKYINPSWRSLIEMNKITFSSELLFILPHSQRTINLQHSNSRKRNTNLAVDVLPNSLHRSATAGRLYIRRAAGLSLCRQGHHLPLPVPRLQPTRQAGLVRLPGNQDQGGHLRGMSHV